MIDDYKSFYTPADVAELFRVERQTVYRWIANRLLDASRVGPRRWRISHEALNQFLNQRTGVPVKGGARAQAIEEVIRRFGIEVRKDERAGTFSKLHYRNGETFPYRGDPATEDEWRLFEALVLLQYESLSRSSRYGN